MAAPFAPRACARARSDLRSLDRWQGRPRLPSVSPRPHLRPLLRRVLRRAAEPLVRQRMAEVEREAAALRGEVAELNGRLDRLGDRVGSLLDRLEERS